MRILAIWRRSTPLGRAAAQSIASTFSSPAGDGTKFRYGKNFANCEPAHCRGSSVGLKCGSSGGCPPILGRSIMPATASVAVPTSRIGQRLLLLGAMIARFGGTMCGVWQRRLDRTTARWIHELDHAGVSDDYRMACRRNYR